jgi:hypothetical protein
MLLKILAVILAINLAAGARFHHADFITDPGDLLQNLDEDEYARDIGIKLKKEFADDLVSDLFATSYGLEKVARVDELNNDKTIFHFKLPHRVNSEEESEDGALLDDSLVNYAQEMFLKSKSSNHIHRRRFKRHVESKIDLLRRDDRVEFVFPQVYLSRQKRRLENSDAEVEQALDSWLDEVDEDILKSLKKENRKKLTGKDLLLSESLRKAKVDNEKSKQDEEEKLPEQINFNDFEYHKQWYLINDGQFRTPPLHDLNVKNAWLSGYTGKNVSIVIVDDGLDHEHPDFDGKYVNIT